MCMHKKNIEFKTLLPSRLKGQILNLIKQTLIQYEKKSMIKFWGEIWVASEHQYRHVIVMKFD